MEPQTDNEEEVGMKFNIKVLKRFREQNFHFVKYISQVL